MNRSTVGSYPGPSFGLNSRPARWVLSGAAIKSWPLNASKFGGRQVGAVSEAVGHRHLRWLLSVHAVLLGEGVVAAFHAYSVRDIDRVLDACRYFGVDAVADLVERIPDAASSPRSATSFDADYQRRYAISDALVDAVRRKISLCPVDFPAEPH